MCSPLHHRRRFGVLLIVVALCGAIWACGPEFPWSLLRDEQVGVDFTPSASFNSETRRILDAPHASLQAKLPAERQNVFEHSAEVDIAEVSAACDDRDAVRVYAALRRSLSNTRGARHWSIARGEAHDASPLDGEIPASIPRVYRLYLHGLIAHELGDRAAALAAWREVLLLPEPERAMRSVWASYMLGRSTLEDDPKAAIQFFHDARALASAGANDALGLATASLGWEARALLQLDRPLDAIKLYAEQHAAGDPSAIPSLRQVISLVRSRNDPDELRSAAADPLIRRLVTAHLLEADRIGRYRDGLQRHPESWLGALDSIKAAPLPDADRIAWAMYQHGRFDTAQRWLAHAEPTSTVALWVRAKLQLRSGDLDGAAATLETALLHTPQSVQWDEAPGASHPYESIRPADRIAGELAVLRVSQGRFDEALTLFLSAGWPIDAAYVAERVMSVDELRNFVDRMPRPVGEHRVDPRDVLSRRLARAGRYDDAAAYADAVIAGELLALARHLQIGRDLDQPLPQRADALRSAARLMRHRGMELIGTTLEPDWAIYLGNFEHWPVHENRTPITLLAPATALELQRVASSAVTVDRRWHYRYLAADLAWEASYLMPNQTEALANWLIEAGMWLAPRDPQAANRFYKALVIRAGATPLGQRAARIRWFPPRP